MKRLLLTLCCTLATALFADTWTDPETNITWTYTLSDGKASLGGGSISVPAISISYAGALTIPATINGSPVIRLNSHAFRGCSSLTSVDIPAGVASIGDGAFFSCSSLASVIISSSVTSVGSEAFRYCTSLTSVVIPEGVTSIGYSAFRDCTALTSVVIPEGVTSIGSSAFFGCTSLTSVVIPSGVTSIWNETFRGCSSLTSVVIPEGVTIIESTAFYDCISLTSVVIPEGVTFIGRAAFERCSSLTSVVIPGSVTSIGDDTFYLCSSLTSVVISEGVTSIGQSAFERCYSLTSVIISGSVTSIGDGAFCDCSSLTSVVIPEGVTSIGGSAFSGCSRLKEVTFLGDVPEGWGNVYPSGKKIYFSQVYAGRWNAVLSAAQQGTILELISKAGVTVTAEMTRPKTMRVTYSVESEQPTVKVRAVAWKDGVRSFANIVPVKTAAEGAPEAVPNGGEVTTGVEHTFVWQVSADWATDLDKVAMEILVEEGTLLPQEKITIPALDDHPEMTITRNGLASWQLFDALVWCYAEGDEALTVTNGVVRVNGTQVANGSSISTSNSNATTLLNYLYGKMGYKVLAGEDLAWARAATRLELADSGLDQVSVKIAEE